MADLIQEQLQMLRDMRDQYQQRYDPAEQQRQLQARNQLIDRYQDVVDKPPQYSMGPVNTLVSSYLSKYTPGQGGTGMIRTIGETSDLMRQRELEDRKRQLGEISSVANMRDKLVSEDDQLLKNQIGLLSRIGGQMGKAPSPEQLRTVYNSAQNKYSQIAKDYQWESAEQRGAWITQRASEDVQAYLTQFSTSPKPEVATAPTPVSAEVKVPEVSLGTTGMKPQDEQELAKKLQANLSIIQDPKSTPEARQESFRVIEQLKRDFPLTQPQVPSGPLRDKRTEAQVKSYGGEEGKELFQERKSLSDLYGSNSKVLGQLNLLDKIYQNPNLPEGELGPYIHQIKSGLKSLGVDVGPEVGVTDLASAVATGLALAQKNADGKNLLPGAMSNYEDQLLQKMAPTLSLTAEGRKSLVQFMKQIAQSNIRLASEGTQYADSRKGKLDQDWYKRKERVMLEEMARLKKMSESLIQQHSQGLVNERQL